VDHNSIPEHLTRSDESFKKCCMSNAVDETDDDMLWNGSEEDGDVKLSVRKMETMTLIGKGI
jgi:hypothetical protein